MCSLPKVVYVSPNRSHHYRYAEGLHRVGLLHRFVSGFPRFSAQADVIDVPNDKMVRVDAWQLLYVAANRFGVTPRISEWLNMHSKRSLDRAFAKAMQAADIGLFYNGTGLGTVLRWNGAGKLFVCEAVNAHVEVQRSLMETEAQRIGLKWQMSDAAAIPRRVEEYARADYILCPSEFVVRSFTSMGIPVSKCLKNPFGMPLPDVPLEDRTKVTKGERIHVLYVGQIHFRKGIRYLIDALQTVKDPRICLHLVGPIYAPTGLDAAALPAWVRMHGVLKGGDLDQAYRNADIFVQPSLEEGLSLVIGEAMGYGLPVIASDHTGAEEILTDQESGLIFSAGNVEQLVSRLRLLMNDVSLRTRIGQKARARAASFNGWEASGEKLSQLLLRAWEQRISKSKVTD